MRCDASACSSTRSSPRAGIDCVLVLCSRGAGAQQNARHHSAACIHGLNWRTHVDRDSFWRHCGDALSSCKVRPASSPRHAVIVSSSHEHRSDECACNASTLVACKPCSWPKPRPLSKLRGLPVSAAAFDVSHPSSTSTGCAQTHALPSEWRRCIAKRQLCHVTVDVHVNRHPAVREPTHHASSPSQSQLRHDNCRSGMWLQSPQGGAGGH